MDPRVFRAHDGHLKIKVDGEVMTLADLVDRIDASTDERPAPHLRNQLLSDWPAELRAGPGGHGGFIGETTRLFDWL